MDPREAFRLDNLPRTILWLLAAFALWLWGLFSQGVYPILQKLVRELPTEVLLVGLVLLLALLVLACGVLFFLWDDNKRLRQVPQFYAAFGAKWKYWPKAKIFEQHPFCGCCEPPSACQILDYRDDSKVESLKCPHRMNIQFADQFHLRDPVGNWLTIKDALDRLQHMEVPYAS